MSHYDTNLDKNEANYVPLSPLTFLERTKDIYPNYEALVYESRSYTWEEVYKRCVKFASALDKIGVKTGDTVSIMAFNTPEIFEAHYAIPMVGAVINAINTRLDPNTVSYILQHSDAKVLIVDRQFHDVIEKALRNVKNKITIMQCTSTYPCRPEDAGINILNDLKKRYKCSLGFSDHTQGCEAAIMAINNGASVIEKHLTFSKKMYGSDAKFAMEIPEFKEYCKSLRKAEILVNYQVDKNLIVKKLKDTRNVFFKSIVSKVNIPKGKIIKMADLAFKKPGHGIPTKFYKKFLGKKANKTIKKNMIIKFSDIN